MIKYKTGGYQLFIEKVEIERESNHYVIFKNGNREKKRTAEWHNYFDTFQEAKDFLIEKNLNAYTRAKKNYIEIGKILTEIKNLKEDS